MHRYDEVEVLIVEDNPTDAELIIRALRDQNLENEIFIAGDGEEALDFLFCRGKYSDRHPCKPMKAIFLDLKLPKINGLEVLKEIKTNKNTKYLPVVILTSSNEDSDILSAYKLGANSYVVKPVHFDAFCQAITNVGLYWSAINKLPKSFT